MTIHKMSSQYYNSILSDAKNKINKMNENIADIKNNIDKKLLIINHENEYLNHCLNKMNYQELQGNTFILLNNNHKGLYETYSNVVHAYFKKSPINVFNLRSINTNSYYFRDEVNVSINGINNDYYKNILKADGIEDKLIFFEEFQDQSALGRTSDDETTIISKDNLINLTIEIDKNKILGVSKFNMIEIDPYLYKSFDIEKINVYTDDYDNPSYTISSIKEVGKTRIMLDKKYEFRKVEFLFAPKYKTTKNDEVVIPFGLKHIYFYEADFRNDSYIILKHDSEDYIDNVKNDIIVYTPVGSFESTIKQEGIEIYLENNNGSLESLQEPSQNVKNPIARNLRTIYFKVPIPVATENSSSYRGSLVAFKFFIETR